MSVTVADEYRPLDSLRPHPRNYNRHPDGQVERMAAKVRTTAFSAPFIVKDDGAVLGGHLRRLGLLKLRAESYPEPEGIRPGWLVPCRVVTCSEVEELAFLAGDNPDPAELDYDTTALTALLAELQQEGALEGAGYDAARLDQLIAEVAGHAGSENGTGDLNGASPPEEFSEYDEDIETEYCCPRCHYAWSGQPKPTGEAGVSSTEYAGDRDATLERL